MIMKTTTLANKLFFYCFFFFTLVFFACHLRAHEVDDESEFSYDEKSHTGPAHWGKIRPEWSMCKDGNMQSPIDLLNERVEVVSNLGRLQRDYRPSNATLTNRGHDMMLRWVDGGGHIHVNGTSYQLRQCHWHSPSEHSINGRRYDLEVHLVHETPDGKIAVFGILYKIGRPDLFLSKMEYYLKALADTRDIEKVVGSIEPKDIELGSRKYYRYIGSLTVPPCTQNVIWTILKKVRTVSKYQVKMIRKAVHDNADANARPIQPTNKRPVKMYRPNDDEQD